MTKLATISISDVALCNGGTTGTSSTLRFDVLFKPPLHLTGTSCYLQLKSLILQDLESQLGHIIKDYITYEVSINLRQINSWYKRGEFVGGDYTQSEGLNSVVGYFNTMTSSEFPRVLVDVPDGPQVLTVIVRRIDGTNIVTNEANKSSFVYVTLLAELIPINLL